ncbi:hypothetical protein C8R43DRAFT_1043540 [Mycena crocata]|nr:hypothetical protein C8R43DRAFT_1043540 [Mycena crocata]
MPSITPSSCHLLPIELWTEIFIYLPREAVAVMSFTHGFFHPVSRPLLFQELTFHPYIFIPGYDAASASHTLPDPAEVDDALQRLQFWSSSEIASFVRTCIVTPWPHSRRTPRPVDPYILLTALFDSLPRFTSLRHLSLHGVPFTPTVMAKLSLLPSLSVLEVKHSIATEGRLLDSAELATLRIANFRFNQNPDAAVNHWFPSLCPDTLHRLDLMYSERLLNHIEGAHEFSRVQTLKIDMGRHSKKSLNLGRFLSKFPAIKQLEVSLWRIEDPQDIFAQLTEPHHLTSLRVGLPSFDTRYLEALCAVFPGLMDLHIRTFVELDNWSQSPENSSPN